tara:strand:+ start:5103 stop:6191 length:1089 start_codon:yes stop_codon:yes gene_type:complete
MAEPTPEKRTPSAGKSDNVKTKGMSADDQPDDIRTGVGNTLLNEPTGEMILADSEKVVTLNDLDGKGPAGCAIILGRDRIHSKWSGKGGRGDTQAFAIRMVAGFGGCNPGIKGAEGYWPDIDPLTGKKLKFNPSFKYDSAMIYLAQKTDVDVNLYLAEGSLGAKFGGKSAAIMKADAVRLISRDGGIKLVANTDTHSSGGKPVKGISTIDFIVNNDDTALQPLVMGDNANALLRELGRWMNEILIQISNLSKSQMILNKTMASHTHSLPPSVMIQNPLPPPAPPQIPASAALGYGVSPDTVPSTGVVIDSALAASVLEHNIFAGSIVEQNLLIISDTLDGLTRDYLNPSGPNYILSRNVNTT